MPIIKPSRHFEGSDLRKLAGAGAEAKSVVEDILGNVLWISDKEGFCACPGAHLHTTSDSSKDCKVYLQPVATVSCFHSSCSVTVEETTKELRHHLAAADSPKDGKKRRLSKEEKARIAQIRAREALRRQASTSRHRVFRDFSWPYDAIYSDSPSTIPSDPASHWRELLGLFGAEDVIWIGGLYQSGKAEHTDMFKSVDGWLESSSVPGHFVCPSTFNPGSFSRCKESIVRRAFLVVESDTLDKNTIGSVFRWMRDQAGMNLRCIVDTAGKSLHGWFDFPPEEELNDLRLILPELECDPKMFTATQPCRLPGALRDGKHQRLIYLENQGKSHE